MKTHGLHTGFDAWRLPLFAFMLYVHVMDICFLLFLLLEFELEGFITYAYSLLLSSSVFCCTILWSIHL
jgi:hypothetical protein